MQKFSLLLMTILVFSSCAVNEKAKEAKAEFDEGKAKVEETIDDIDNAVEQLKETKQALKEISE